MSDTVTVIAYCSAESGPNVCALIGRGPIFLCDFGAIKNCRPRSNVPHPPRVFIPGLSVHIIQRGNNRADIFDIPSDYG